MIKKVEEFRKTGQTFRGSRKQMAKLIGLTDMFQKGGTDDLIRMNYIVDNSDGTYSFVV